MTRADTLRKIRQLLNVFHYTKREVDQINEIIEREIQAHTHNFVTEDEFNNILIQYGLIRSPETIGNIILTTDKSILSHVNNESAIFSATVYDENGDVVTGETVTFYINDEVYDTATTDATGVATVSYSSQGAGDLYIKAKNNGMSSTETYIQDYNYVNSLTNPNTVTFTTLNGSAKLTYSNNGLEVIGNSTSGDTLIELSNYNLPNKYEAEITIVDYATGDYSHTGGFMFESVNIEHSASGSWVNGNSGYDIFEANAIIKIVYDASTCVMEVYKNGELKATVNNVGTTHKFQFKTYNNRKLTVKDLKVKSL